MPCATDEIAATNEDDDYDTNDKEKDASMFEEKHAGKGAMPMSGALRRKNKGNRDEKEMKPELLRGPAAPKPAEEQSKKEERNSEHPCEQQSSDHAGEGQISAHPDEEHSSEHPDEGRSSESPAVHPAEGQSSEHQDEERISDHKHGEDTLADLEKEVKTVDGWVTAMDEA